MILDSIGHLIQKESISANIQLAAILRFLAVGSFQSAFVIHLGVVRFQKCCGKQLKLWKTFCIHYGLILNLQEMKSENLN